MCEETASATTDAGPLDQGAGDALAPEAGPPPRCRVALTALLLALVLLPPWVAWVCRGGGLDALRLGTYVGALGGLLAAALGIAGIVRTSQRKRRGRGMAVAAIPLGLAAALLQGLFGMALTTWTTTHRFASDSVKILAASDSQLHGNTTSWYAVMPSDRFKEAVAPEDFEFWLQGLVAQRGQLQSVEMTQVDFSEGGEPRVRFRGQFVNGAATIEVVIGIENGRPKIDDLRVGHSSPLN